MTEAAKPTEAANGTGADEFRLLDFFERNGACLGAADLFLMGRSGRAERMADFAAILRVFSRADGPAFAHIVLVLPPGSDIESERVAIRAAFATSLSGLLKRRIEANEVDKAFRNVSIVSAATLQGGDLGNLIRAARAGAAFVVANAALYRVEGVEVPAYRPSLQEDFWSPHLHAVAGLLHEASGASNSYVVLDAGEEMPERPENRNLLLSIDGAVTDVQRDGPSRSEFTQRYEGWQRSAEQGRLDPVLREIDGLDVEDRRKTILKAQMFKFAGAFEAARTVLEAGLEQLHGLEPEVALQVAVLADSVDADEVASILLNEAIPGLRSREFLGAGLELADSLGDRMAVAAAEAALSASFPASDALLVHRAKILVRERRFFEAAEIFRQVGAEESESAAFYEMLAGALSYATPDDATAALEPVAKRFPSRKASALRFFAQDLEVRGHRAVGIALLVAYAGAPGSPPERLLVRTALSMVERGRLMLDQTIDDEIVQDALSIAIRYLAFHPADADMRVNVVRIVSPEVLGSIGLPTMAKLVLDVAAAGDSIRANRRVEDRAKACPPERLTEIMRRGFDAMAQGGAVMGHFAFPPDALSDSPAAVVRGFAEMIEHMGERAMDDGDVRAIEACLLMATAIAPLGDEPDEDLVVMRLAAGRLAFGGRVQYARDLAEQALRMAGDSSHRRRLAWFAFADVYARAGNLTEASSRWPAL
ncbi:hypothetical protein ACE103_01245 [Bradyrhizobium sp. ma5]|uniref:hypothetical protein n=1 Tax=Bradyrhizobium sp. ma5 TaxID=3344828 RepID=UPI0035D4EE3E